MLVEYDGYKIVVDKDADFIMLQGCYRNGCNCYNCTERVFDGCIIDEINIEDIK